MNTERKNYFEVKSTGFNEDSQREEIQINCGENGVLYLFKTDEGFIVDVYNQDDNVSTLAVFETDLEPEEESDEDKVYNQCELIYTNSGYEAVIAHVDEQQRLDNPLYKDVKYKHCTPCEEEMPHLNNVCLVCGNVYNQ